MANLRSEEREVGKWTARLDDLKRDRQTVESQWAISLDQYELTDTEMDGMLTDENLSVNMAFSSIKIMMRSCASGNPYIYVNPTRPEYAASSDVLEFLVNDHWRSQRRKKILRRIVLDALLLKVGYGMSHLKLNQITGQYDSVLTRVSPIHLWLAPGSLSIADAYYVIRKVIMPWDLAHKRWPDANIVPADPQEIYGDLTRHTGITSIFNHYDGSMLTSDDDMSRCIIYEVHNQLKRERSAFYPGYNRYLIKPEKSQYPFKSHFTELIFNEKVLQHYGIGDLEPAAKQQEELNRVRKSMMVHNKRFNRKYATEKNNLDPRAKQQLESSEDGAIVEMANIEGFQPIKDAPLSGDVYVYEDRIKQDYREILGISEYQRAGAVPRTKTKYETQQIVAGGQMRAGEKQELTEDFIEEIAEKDLVIMKAFYSEDRVVPLLGEDGVIWRNIQQDDLQGVHKVNVQAGSVTPKDEMSEFQKGMLIHQIFGNDPNVDPIVERDIVTRLLNVPFRTQLLKPQPLKQLELQGTRSGPANMPSGMNPMMQGLPNTKQLANVLKNPNPEMGGPTG